MELNIGDTEAGGSAGGSRETGLGTRLTNVGSFSSQELVGAVFSIE